MSPLDDEEVLELVLWETPAEIAPFRAGWLVRRMHGPQPGVEARSMPWVCDLPQVQRVAFERGWLACDAVRRLLTEEGAPIEEP